MSTTDSSSSDEEPLPPLFSKNPLFNDITPISQDDGPHPVVQIAYSENFKDCYDYFRAIYEKHELSKRALDLTEACIRYNPANYTVWEYRRQIVKELCLNVDDELQFTKEKMGSNPKNYQMWHHRAVLLGFKNEVKQADIDGELDLVGFVVSNDSKNYHAWQHRICLLQNPVYQPFFDLKKETVYSQTLISQDYRNNSAWNYLFTINQIFKSWSKFDYSWLETCIFETNSEDLMNESSWSFLSGCFKFMVGEIEYLKPSFFSKTVDLVDKLSPEVPHVMVVFLLDHYKEMEFDVSVIRGFVKGLETSDPVRINYWKFMQSCLV